MWNRGSSFRKTGRYYKNKKSQSGFTLIELLVVMLIISITIGVVGFSVSSIQSRNSVQPFVERLYQKISYYGQAAMLKQTEIGLSFYDNKIEVLTYNIYNKNKTWQIKEEIKIPSSTNIQIKIPDAYLFSKNIASDYQDKNSEDLYNNNNAPEIIFSSNGSITPFKLMISHPSEANDYLINGEFNGAVSSQVLTKESA